MLPAVLAGEANELQVSLQEVLDAESAATGLRSQVVQLGEKVLDVAKAVVGWDAESIVAAIRRHAIDEPHREFQRTLSAEEREDYSRYIEGDSLGL